MRKVIIALLVLGAAGFAGWWFFLRVTGTPPSMALRLEAAHTAAFMAFEGPEVLAKELSEAVTRATAKASAEVKTLVSADTAVKQIHFDPRSADGWKGIGVDPAAGLAVVNDTRLKGEPIVLLGLTDQAKFLQWVEKLSGVAPKYEEGSPAVLSIGEQRYFVGKRGNLTAVVQARDESKAGFSAFLTGAGDTLAKAENFAPAFRDAKAGARSVAWVGTAGLAAMAEGDADAKKVFEYYATLFPAFAFYAGPEAGGLRLLATEKGAEALRQTLMPANDPPAFSAWIPAEGWAAMRLSVNIKELFTGVEALLPPTVPPEVKSQLGMAKLGVAMVTGVAWDDLAEGFGGHFVVAGRVASLKEAQEGGQPEWLALISATSKADSLLDSLVGQLDNLMGNMGGEKLPIEKVTLAGQAARQVKIGPMTLVAARVDDVVVVASSPKAFEDAVGRKGKSSLKGSPAGDALDGEVVYGLAVPFAALKDLAQDMGGEQAVQVLTGLDPGRPHIAFSIGLDRHGLYSKGDGSWALAAVASMGGLTAPFWLFARRSAEIEVRAVQAEAMEAEALRAAIEAPPSVAPITEAAPATEAAPTTEAAPATVEEPE